jgi:hypothetical protein
MSSFLAPQILTRDTLICEEYVQGVAVKELSNKYKTSKINIYRILNKYKTKIRSGEYSKRKYPTNQEYFSKIDTEEKAYILGFLYADGYNNVADRTVKLVLNEGDKEILEQINNCIQPYKPLYFLDHSRRRSLGSKVLDCYSMSISSEKMCQDLVRLGCPQSKTFKISFPTSHQVPKGLIQHFIRGYFDGDGCIKILKNGEKQSFSLVGTESFLNSIQNFFVENLGITNTKLYKPKTTINNNIAVLSHSSLKNCIKIRNFLYKNATIFMKRKYTKFNNIGKGVSSV